MFTTQKSELLQHFLKTCALGLAVISLVFSTPGFCDKKQGNEAKVIQLLKGVAEMPMPKESDQLGPHPSDPAYAEFKAQRNKVVDMERAQEEADAATKQRIKALSD